MPSAESRRRAATLIDHRVIKQPCCVYCGNAGISPRLYPSGDTRHLDHFMPIEIVARARHYNASARIMNWVLPCCLKCNLHLGQLFFSTFADKFDYLRERKARLLSIDCLGAPLQWQRPWTMPNNPASARLASIKAPAAIGSMIGPIEAPGYVIICPRKGETHWATGQDCERTLTRPNATQQRWHR
jgi:hypothetical protein